jgi:hypothetical protein
VPVKAPHYHLVGGRARYGAPTPVQQSNAALLIQPKCWLTTALSGPAEETR